MEERKIKEVEWADKRRTINASDKKKVKKYLANKKYYSVAVKTKEYVAKWIRENCLNMDVFEMACGSGGYSTQICEVSKSCIAADIAPLSIEQAKENAKTNSKMGKVNYMVLDCENTGLQDDSFDVICEGGALHHMDLKAVFGEAVRLLRPGGKFMCVEAIKHNPFIHLYRKLTPNLRTEWEVDHILGKSEIMSALDYFERIDILFFHITSIIAVPFRSTFFFKPLLKLLEAIDSILVKVPGLKWMAWQAVFVLSGPKKDNTNSRQVKEYVI